MKPLNEMEPPEIESHMQSLLLDLGRLIKEGAKYVAAEKAAEGEIHIAEGKGYAGSKGDTTKAKEMDAKAARGEAEKRTAQDVALGWAARTKVKALLAEIDVCRSIYSARKAEYSNTRG